MGCGAGGAELLVHLAGQEGQAEGLPLVSGQPGRGGVTRGRADAELFWGEESPGRSDQFAPKQLPGARAFDPDSSTPMGVTAGAPTVEPVAEGGGTQATTEAAARSAWRRRLAPSHRAAVKKFFAPSEQGTPAAPAEAKAGGDAPENGKR